MDNLNIEAALAAKNPKLLKWIPRFIIRWIEKTIHQEELNQFYMANIDLPPIEFAAAGVQLFSPEITIVNKENIPTTGRYIIASNHPLGGLDGIALIATIGQYRQDIKTPVNDLLLHVKPFQKIFIPIAKVGKNSRENFKQLDDAFAGDDLIIYFPAGICSRRHKGVIQDPAWKKTVIVKARETQRDIIPVHFGGRNSNRFYNIANFRKKIGIKANIEMLFLVDEMYRQSGKSFNVIFGKPIPYTQFNNDKNDKDWAAWLQDIVYKLPTTVNNLP